MQAISTESIFQQVLRTAVAGMPLEWIDYREAVRLYHTGQVAYACGFNNLSYFSRSFKAQFGQLPSDYVRNKS